MAAMTLGVRALLVKIINIYAARKLRLKSTGNADGNGVGPNNFYLEPGTASPKDITAGE